MRRRCLAIDSLAKSLEPRLAQDGERVSEILQLPAKAAVLKLAQRQIEVDRGAAQVVQHPSRSTQVSFLTSQRRGALLQEMLGQFLRQCDHRLRFKQGFNVEELAL
jgi:hypothetical protein